MSLKITDGIIDVIEDETSFAGGTGFPEGAIQLTSSLGITDFGGISIAEDRGSNEGEM